MFFPPQIGYFYRDDHGDQPYACLEDISEDETPIIRFRDTSCFYQSFRYSIGIIHAHRADHNGSE